MNIQDVLTENTRLRAALAAEMARGRVGRLLVAEPVLCDRHPSEIKVGDTINHEGIAVKVLDAEPCSKLFLLPYNVWRFDICQEGITASVNWVFYNDSNIGPFNIVHRYEN